jgi:hypothetical protein
MAASDHLHQAVCRPAALNCQLAGDLFLLQYQPAPAAADIVTDVVIAN